MNVNATTPVAGVPCTDAPAASAVPSAGPAGAFAAILDAASGNDAGSGRARAALDSTDDTDPAASDIAAIAAASLLAIAQMAPVEDAQDDDTSESSSDSVGDVSTESAQASDGADAGAQPDTEISVKTVVDASGNASSGAPPDEVPPASVPDSPPYVPSPRYDPAPPYDPGGEIQTTTATSTTTTRAVETAATHAASSTRPAAEATTSPSRATAEAASEADRRDVRESTTTQPTTTQPTTTQPTTTGSATTAVVNGKDVVDPGVDRAAGNTERAASNVASASHTDSKRIASDASLPWYPGQIYQPGPDAQTTQSDQGAGEQAGQSTAALPSIGDITAEQATESPRAGSAASRFARAVERASSGIVPQPRTEDAAANDGATGQGGTQQDERGQSFADRAAQPIALPRAESAHGPVFTLGTPTSWDLRGVAAADAAIATGEGARIEIPDRDVVMQVVQSMRLQFRDGIGEAVLKLKPEHLGTVSISLRIENGAVSAHVQAGVGEVRQWLESNQSMLRDSLAEQGLRLERFVVESEEKRDASTDENADRGQSRRRRSPRPRAVASDQPIFEVLA